MRRQPQPSAEDLAALDPDGRFRDRLEADRQALGPLSESGNLSDLHRIIHGLAGAAGTFGYNNVGEIAIEIDDRLREGDTFAAPDIARLLTALERALGEPEKSA